jgi:hypothetical protein
MAQTTPAVESRRRQCAAASFYLLKQGLVRASARMKVGAQHELAFRQLQTMVDEMTCISKSFLCRISLEGFVEKQSWCYRNGLQPLADYQA